MNSTDNLPRGPLSPAGAVRRTAHSGFTLLELMTVLGMIALVMGAMTAAVGGANERAKVQKAQAEVKSITQAILGYENYAGGLEDQVMANRECDRSSLGFLLGNAQASQYGTKIPVLLMASLASNGKMLDPWGNPYRLTIRKGKVSISSKTAASSMSTGYVLPNFYRLSKEERE